MIILGNFSARIGNRIGECREVIVGGGEEHSDNGRFYNFVLFMV